MFKAKNIIGVKDISFIATHHFTLNLEDVFGINENLTVVLKSKVYYKNKNNFHSELLEIIEPKNNAIFGYLKEHDNLINPMNTRWL